VKIKVYKPIINSGILEPTDDEIIIRKGRYLQGDVSHPLRFGEEKYYTRKYGLKYKRKKVYWLNRYASPSEETGIHVAFSKWQHQRFLWLQGSHWFQKEENIRYIVNVIFLIIGVLISLKIVG
jgi:hypothetical protein